MCKKYVFRIFIFIYHLLLVLLLSEVNTLHTYRPMAEEPGAARTDRASGGSLPAPVEPREKDRPVCTVRALGGGASRQGLEEVACVRERAGANRHNIYIYIYIPLCVKICIEG